MRGSKLARRGAITLLNAIVVVAILFLIAYFVLPTINSTRGRHNTCRSNLRNIALAMVSYESREGHYPGYSNVLTRTDDSPYIDPDLNRPVPVSWVVELLSDLDRGALREQWRYVPDKAALPTPLATNPTYIPNVKVYLEILTCSSDADKAYAHKGTPLSYVVNSGMPDLPQGVPGRDQDGSAKISDPGTPRDWPANGLFFDNYSDDKRIKPNAKDRAPMVVMRRSLIRDPLDKTLMLTENLDATSYTYDPKEVPDGDPTLSEVAWGFTWAPGQIDAAGGKTRLAPAPSSPAPNAERGVRNHGPSYKYCRPSSSHPGGFNVAFAGSNVVFMRDTISYYVYAKLMSSDDAGMKLPGSQELLDARLRDVPLQDADLNP